MIKTGLFDLDDTLVDHNSAIEKASSWLLKAVQPAVTETERVFFTHRLIITAEEAGSSKPHQQIFAYACTKLGIEAAETMYVGDLLDLDAIASRDAGLIGVWLNRVGSQPKDCPSDIRQINTLTELSYLL